MSFLAETSQTLLYLEAIKLITARSKSAVAAPLEQRAGAQGQGGK